MRNPCPCRAPSKPRVDLDGVRRVPVGCTTLKCSERKLYYRFDTADLSLRPDTLRQCHRVTARTPGQETVTADTPKPKSTGTHSYTSTLPPDQRSPPPGMRALHSLYNRMGSPQMPARLSSPDRRLSALNLINSSPATRTRVSHVAGESSSIRTA